VLFLARELSSDMTTMQKLFLLLVAIAQIVLWDVASAKIERSIERDLPRNYVGYFRWQGDSVRQKVEVRLDIVRRREQQSVEALGCGRYDAAGVIITIGVKMVISEPGLEVEVFESDPAGSPGFTVDGSHVGGLSKDLRHLTAEWTTRTTGTAGLARGGLAAMLGGGREQVS
jgi:hypothetical protein